jgi:hypothetical protein
MLSLAKEDRDSKAGPALIIGKDMGMISVNYAARWTSRLVLSPRRCM